MLQTQAVRQEIMTEGSKKDALWSSYKATGSMTLRNELVMLYINLVEIIARKMHHIFDGKIQLDDIISNGTIALIGAVESFDINRGVKFETYASLRIRGSVIDYIREQDFVPRSVREKAKKVDAAFVKLRDLLGREPTIAEISAEIGLNSRVVEDIMAESHSGNVFSLEELLQNRMETTFEIEDDTSLIPQELILRKELKSTLKEAIDCLNEKERLVTTLYYYEGLKVKDIAKVMDISSARVCQIHSTVLLKLKAKLNKYVSS